MMNFNEEYFKEFTDEYAEYNSKFKVLTDYQKEDITKRIDSEFKKIIEDVDNLDKSSARAISALSISKHCLRFNNSFKSFRDVLIYRGVLNNLIRYKKSNGMSVDTEEHTECPLDVRLQVVHNTPIYDAEGNEYAVEYVEKDVFSVYSTSYMSFRWSDYMVTWYLKKDKSE